MSTEDEIIELSATALAAALRGGEVGAEETMRAYLGRIEAINPVVNAIVAPLTDREALDLARKSDRRRLRGDELGPLHGVPTAVKDVMRVKGFPTTHGSAAFADAGPDVEDSLLAQRLRASGALIIGKTNTPEMGLGVLSFNAVYGTTVNPWDLTRHAGGSSGGAAAAVSARLLPIADGSDSGGSLRYPAAFCNVVGVRPTPGRFASSRGGDAWTPHGVLGPMARDAHDAAFVLQALSGPSPKAPLSHLSDPGRLTPLETLPVDGLRIAWSADLGGLPVDPEVARVHRDLRERLVRAGAVVDDVEPDFDDVDEAWITIELFGHYLAGRDLIAGGRTAFRADFIRNVCEGASVSAQRLGDAFERRTRLFRDTAAILESYDAFVAPATPVVAPPADVEWVEEVDGVRFSRYFWWQMMANRVTVTAHPVVVTGAGFSAAGLPVGVQVVGPYAREARALAVAAAIEDLTGTRAQWPGQIPVLGASAG